MFFIFDLDDTLVDTSESITPALLERVVDFLADVAVLPIETSLAKEQILKINAASSSSEEAVKTFFHLHSIPVHLMEEGKSFLKRLPSDLPVKPVPDAHRIFEVFQHHQFAVVTVGVFDFQIEKLKKAGFDLSLFSKIVVTKEKNKGLHYKALLTEFQKSPNETVVIGDRIEVDLTPAKHLGCRTVHLLRGRGAIKSSAGVNEDVDYTVRGWNELIDSFGSNEFHTQKIREMR